MALAKPKASSLGTSVSSRSSRTKTLPWALSGTKSTSSEDGDADASARSATLTPVRQEEWPDLLATLDARLVSTHSAVTSVLGGLASPGLRSVCQRTHPHTKPCLKIETRHGRRGGKGHEV